MMAEQTWKPMCDVTHLGLTPNVFDLIGCVGLTLKRFDRPKQRDDFRRRVKGTISYKDAVSMMQEYVDLVLEE